MGTARAASDPAPATPPVNVRPPRIEGTARTGQLLRAGRGTWRHDRRAAFSYQWQLCDASATTCEQIPGANDRIYAVRPTDVGQRVLVVVTATTPAGSKGASSGATPAVLAAPTGVPLATARPAVTGTIQVGSVLTADDGTWTGVSPIRFDYRWRRCTPLGGACEAVGRTSQTYRISAKDIGHTLRVLVRAGDRAGTSVALSDPTIPVPGPTPPVTRPDNTALPLISGVAAEGRALTASSGTWSGTTPLRFAFQWQRCTQDGNACSPIGQATAQAYTLVQADVGHTVRVAVTASNAAGSGSAVSGRTRVVVGPNAPVDTAVPTISGTAREGSVLTSSPGQWRGTQPIAFQVQWLRCDTGGSSCAAIPGATGDRRGLTSSDVGRTLRVRVTATNAGGSAAVLSGPSPVIARQGVSPANRAGPVLGGAPRQGSRLSLSTGAWTGTQPITFSYEWLRCDVLLAGCRPIAGSTSSTYVLTSADVGHRIVGVVTARNEAGASTARSNPTTVVFGAPVNTSLPTITGTPVQGQTLTATNGSWAGSTPAGFGYQWTRCGASGAFPTCVPIVVTSRPSYTLRPADVGHRILVQVKAFNSLGASFVDSAQTAVVTAAPSPPAPPPAARVTLRPARGVVSYGGTDLLTGTAVGVAPGTQVTVVVRPVGAPARVLRNVAAIGDQGTWSYLVRPTVTTTYQAQVGATTSAVTSIGVRPRLKLRRIAAGEAWVRVFASRSFAGRTAFVQRWDSKRHRWTVVRTVALRPTAMGWPPTDVTVAVFRPGTPPDAPVRVVLRHREAGPGYLTGISNRVRA